MPRQTTRPRAGRPAAAPRAERIVDSALELAEIRGWDNVRLYQVAERLDLPLDEVAREFRDLDAVANAWFARARDTMLAEAPRLTAGLPPAERLHVAIMAWFDALAPHREVTGQMLREKLWPVHVHHWVPMVFDLSRLVHWFLDAASIASTGVGRQLAESGLTLIFVATLRTWLDDPTPNQRRTRAALRRRLARADRVMSLATGTRPGRRRAEAS